jgi:hypothetical protein
LTVPLLILLATLLQAATPEPQTAGIPVSLERIRRGLEREGPALSAAPPEVSIFRVRVTERRLPYDLLWQGDQVVPSYVRPRQPIGHYNFLSMATPEAFRSGTLYPCCIPVMPAVQSVQRAVRRGIRSYAQARAKRIVQEDLERLKNARRTP